jgi:hypothetical protein
MGNILSASDFDGADYGQPIKGTILKCIDGRWSAKDSTTLRDGEQFLILSTISMLQHWADGLPSETILKKPGQPFPDVDELNNQIPQETWEKGLDGKPRPPGQRQWVVYLVRVSDDGSMFTFLNSTFGARLAVQKLAGQVIAMRTLSGARVLPLVTLAAKPMKTKFGEKMRPHFEIVDWREFGRDGEPAPQIHHKPSGSAEQIGKPVEPVAIKKELSDEMPF